MKRLKIESHTICSRAPLRLGLAGGGTDVSPYCDRYGGCVLNAAIGYHVYAVLKPRHDFGLRFVAADQGRDEAVAASLPLSLEGGGLILHRAVYNTVMARFNGGVPVPLEVVTYSDVPQGSGLGASSTLVVAMLKGYAEFFNLPLDSFEIARMAFEIERGDCGLRGGRQDYYSAVFGGFNYMEFGKGDRTTVCPLHVEGRIVRNLESSFVLYYTGVARMSSAIIAEQIHHVEQAVPETLDALHRMRREALAMKESLLTGDFSGLVAAMHDGWEAKKASASTIATPHIMEIYNAAMKAGALAGKVSGAGGGGFMVFFVPHERRMDVVRALGMFDTSPLSCMFSYEGVRSWKK